MWGAPSAVGASADTGLVGLSAIPLCLGRVSVVQVVSVAPVRIHMRAHVPMVPVSERPHVL